MLNVQIGDIVRVRHTIELIPISDAAPREIPAGIYGQVSDIAEVVADETFFKVDFHEPYEVFNEIAIRSDMLEVMFRISLN